MTEPNVTRETQSPDSHRATAMRASRLSPIWIIPFLALLIGAWLVYDNYRQRGPLVTLTSSSAEGIEAGKTPIKTRNVDIGIVEEVRLSEDLEKALIMARLTPEAEKMLVDDSRFWVVKPRISREGISGLNTVLSGAYIQLQPGQSRQAKSQFTIQEQPPISMGGNDGLSLKLISQLGNSLRAGDPVTYQGYVVGRVESAEFNRDSQQMHHKLFIEEPYDELVTENTRFWSAKGFDLNLTSEGIKLNIASAEALISGGVTFGVLEPLDNDPQAKDEHEFTLYADEEAARQGSYNRYLEYVLLVEDTVRGLTKGAPVEYRGIRVGTVMQVPWRFTSEERNAEQGYAIPVLIRLEPQRLDADTEISLSEWQTRLKNMIENGMRASLQSGNLLTGALFVDLNFDQEAETVSSLATFENKTVMPTTATGLAQLEQKVSRLLDKLNGLEIEPLLTGLEQNLQVSQNMLTEVQTLVEDMQKVVNNPKLQSVPDNINQTLNELQNTLKGFDQDSPAYRELTRSLKRLDNLLQDLQPAAQSISEQPSRLIFDQQTGEDPVPKAPESGD